MKSRWNIGRLRKGRLLKVVAMMFLLHTGVDLFFPELCTEEPFGAALTQTVTPSHAAKIEGFAAGVVADFNQSKEQEPSEPKHRDEDCFCCCAHVMPSPLFVNPESAELRLPDSSPPNVLILSTPLPNPYHPPRFV